jgi:ATP/maltotriose-dependent transcriptional regulator MalT
LLRLQGEFTAAEAAYREANRHGWEPQPGLAQLRLAQGKSKAATAAIRRALSETTEPVKPAALLPAHIEIMLAAGEVEEARAACQELDGIAATYESAMLGAMVAHARGAVALAEGDGRDALVALRRAAQIWQELEAPYEDARARVLIGLACRSLGDDEAAELELGAARAAFTELGATPDVARIDSLVALTGEDAHGLTRRELEVLRLVAAGKSNREIAAALVISEHTVARHVQNIFAKLDVSSRAAAGAFAFEHDLV